MYIFCMILLVFFAIIGLSSFISAVMNLSYRGKGELLIVLNDLKADNAELRIRRAARLCKSTRGSCILCVCRENDPAYDIVRLMQREYPFIEIADSLA